MILPPELLLDSLAGQLPETWRALQEPLGSIQKLSVATIYRSTELILDHFGRRTMLAFTGNATDPPELRVLTDAYSFGVPQEHGIMLTAVRLPDLELTNCNCGSLFCTRDHRNELVCDLVRGETLVAQLRFNDPVGRSRWSAPAVLVPIPPRQTYYLRFYDPAVLRLEDTLVEFWGWPLTPGFWR